MVDNGENQAYYHNDSLAFARRAHGVATVIGIANKEEQTDQAELHNIQPSKELINGCWVQKATSIESEFGDVEGIIPVNEPEEAEGNDIEDHNQWANDRVD